MYFFSGDATCLKVIEAEAVMSVNRIGPDSLTTFLTTSFLSSTTTSFLVSFWICFCWTVWARAEEKEKESSNRSVSARRIISYLWPALSPSIHATFRAGSHLPSCGRRPCTRGLADNARAPGLASVSPRSRGFRRCRQRRPAVTTLCRVRSKHQQNQDARQSPRAST